MVFRRVKVNEHHRGIDSDRIGLTVIFSSLYAVVLAPNDLIPPLNNVGNLNPFEAICKLDGVVLAISMKFSLTSMIYSPKGRYIWVSGSP